MSLEITHSTTNPMRKKRKGKKEKKEKKLEFKDFVLSL